MTEVLGIYNRNIRPKVEQSSESPLPGHWFRIGHTVKANYFTTNFVSYQNPTRTLSFLEFYQRASTVLPMVDNSFNPSAQVQPSAGVIIQRRSSVIREVPRNVTEHGSTEEVHVREDEEQEQDETETSKPNDGTVAGTRQVKRKARRNGWLKRESDDDDDDDDDWNPSERKPHRCGHCPMKFKKPSALVIHMRTHSGEKPYKCKLCTKRFSISGNLRRHMFTHTGEKPYKCQACGRAFNNPSHLARHSKKIHI